MSYLPEVASLGAEGDEQNGFEALEKLNLEKLGSGLLLPLNWRIVVAPLAPPKKTKGGIILADDTADAQDYLAHVGKVLRIGDLGYTEARLRGTHGAAIRVWPGDWVIFARYAGARMSYRGLRIVLMNDDDVLGVTDDPLGYKILV
jgi:co-chaperonin GroES (HSP10)